MRIYILAILFSFVLIACSGSNAEVETEALLPELTETQETEPTEMAEDIGSTDVDLGGSENNETEASVE